MTNIATLIDQLPPPQFPDYFTDQERQTTLLALASAKQQIRPYDGNFDAPWLLTPFESPIWETSNRGREEMLDGKWQNTIRIDWNVRLPNGMLLTDARYETLLTLAKKIAFFARSGIISGPTAPAGWAKTISHLINLVRWTVLHEQRFQPNKYGLKLLDQPTLDWLFGLIAEGSWTNALMIPERILAALYRGAHGVVCPQLLIDKLGTIPTTDIEPLVRWLEQQGGYRTVERGAYFGKRHLRRELLAKLIDENPQVLIGHNVLRFLRQFEPDFRSESLLLSAKQSTELPPQKTESSQESNNSNASEGTVHQVSYLIATVLDAHRHVPDLLPEPANISLRRAKSLANRVARASSHTLFMPVNTGLAYLNAAMRFVHVYGESIVEFYLTILANYTDSNPSNGNVRLNRAMKRRMKDFCIASGEPVASILNITQFRFERGQKDFDRFRSNPTLDEALRVLIGSCIVCMALLKPSREDELTHLKRNCLRDDAGGYSIRFNLGKSKTKVVEAWQETDRPIPVISAKAIHLLQRLGKGLSTLFTDDRQVSDNLFYLPKAAGFEALNATSSLLNNHLDIFCDYVGLPPDSEGRRWYVRIHEMRKWFLLLLFWSGRFDVLDAARWIAGHTDAKHVYAYIENEFPGEELPQIEAEYSIDRMYRREKERMDGQSNAGNIDGVDSLYEAVLRHFNVESLTMVPESEWAGYVHALRKDEQFHLEPHSIFGDNGQDIVGINVSFVMREAT